MGIGGRKVPLGMVFLQTPKHTGAPEFACLRTIVMNLQQRGRYRSIRPGLRELACDIQGMLALGDVATRASSA